MGEILEQFGVDWAKFTAQVIIVLVVYFILAKFAFGPVLAMLDARRKRIQEGENNLKKIEDDMARAEERIQGMLDDANKDAERLIAEARESAEGVRSQKTQEAINEAQLIVKKAQEQAKRESENAMRELKRELGELVISTTGKVTGKVLTAEDQKFINEEAEAQLKVGR